MDIQALMLEESSDYTDGWNDCVCWIVQQYDITKRGEPIQIVIDLDEEKIIKALHERESRTDRDGGGNE